MLESEYPDYSNRIDAFFCVNCGWISGSENCCMNYPEEYNDTTDSTIELIKDMSNMTRVPVRDINDMYVLIPAAEEFGYHGTADTLRVWTERMRYHIDQEFVNAFGDAKAS